MRFAALVLVILLAPMTASAQIPEKALKYRRLIHQEVLRVWGLNIPDNAYAISAGTIHQESAWNPTAQSPYAKGLTQFTDATWGDMLRHDPSIGTLGNVWEPAAAIRAMVTYHRLLWGQLATIPVASDNRWAFVLSSYNGGLGNVKKDQTLCKVKPRCNALLWFGHVELYSNRASWAFKENRGYPSKIIYRWVPLYRYY